MAQEVHSWRNSGCLGTSRQGSLKGAEDEAENLTCVFIQQGTRQCWGSHSICELKIHLPLLHSPSITKSLRWRSPSKYILEYYKVFIYFDSTACHREVTRLDVAQRETTALKSSRRRVREFILYHLQQKREILFSLQRLQKAFRGHSGKE